MKLQYTEHRTTVNRDHVEVIGGEFTADKIEPFQDAVLKEVKVCLDNDAMDVAHKLLDWCHQVTAVEVNMKPGTKLVHNYGTGLDPVGTWEIIA